MKHAQTATPVSREVKPRKKPVTAVVKKPANAARRSNPFGAGRDEMIRQTAYSFYEARSCAGGHELDDWLQAEAHVNQLFAQQAQGRTG